MKKFLTVAVLLIAALFATTNANGKIRNNNYCVQTQSFEEIEFSNATGECLTKGNVYLDNNCDCYKIKFTNNCSERIQVDYDYKGAFGQLDHNTVFLNGNSSKTCKAGSDGKIRNLGWSYPD